MSAKMKRREFITRSVARRRVAEDCVMTITPIFLGRFIAEVPAEPWKASPKRWRAIRRLDPRRRRS